jgi:hypothetical protein
VCAGFRERAVARSDRLRLVVECGTSYGYSEEIRAVTIIPEGSQSQPGTPQVLNRGYAELLRTPLRRSSHSGDSPKLAVSPYSLTMVTGQWACRTTASETLPNKALPSLPWPLLPITINPAPISSATSTISSSALPSRR